MERGLLLRNRSKIIFVVVVSLLLPLLLSACGDDPSITAEEFWLAVNRGDNDEAKDKACEDIHDDVDELIRLSEENDIRYRDISCEADGDNVTCSFEIVSDGQVIDEIEDQEFRMDDGKICEIAESTGGDSSEE